MKLKLFFVIAILLSASLAAQQTETIELTDFPVPMWPADGVVPAEMKDKYVFIDLPKNEYVVVYPENLGSETFEKDGPGPLRRARYDLLRNVAPQITVEISAAGPQKFKYAYTVINEPAAKQSIDQWALVLPEQVGNETLKGPAGWFNVLQRNRTFKLKKPEWIRSGAAAVWSFAKPEEVIQPGSLKTGFEVESELRPGFTVAYFRKAESVEVKVATQGNVPKAVKDQIDSVLAVEYNSRTLLTLAPKFDSGANDVAVAADFIEGIGFLSRTGALDPNSDFVKTTLTELKAIQPGSGPAKISATARSRVETQVVTALKASLKL